MYLNIILPALLPKSRPMTSHHVTCYVTTVTCLFIIKENKNKNKNQRKKY